LPRASPSARAGATIIHTHAYDGGGPPVSNLALVEEAVKIVRDHGAEPASAADLRRTLKDLP
jgi:uncharacterized protein (DUF849 family)